MELLIEIWIKIMSKTDKKSIQNFALTCYKNYALIKEFEFAIFCNMYIFSREENKKNIFDIVNKEKIYIGGEVTINMPENDRKYMSEIMYFLLRNSDTVRLSNMDLDETIWKEIRCAKTIEFVYCTIKIIPYLSECQILSIVYCSIIIDDWNKNTKILPNCRYLNILGDQAHFRSFPQIPSCVFARIEGCTFDILPDFSNCNILVFRENNFTNVLNLANCKLLITDLDIEHIIKSNEAMIYEKIHPDDYYILPVEHPPYRIDQYVVKCLYALSNHTDLSNDLIDTLMKLYMDFVIMKE